ncbi:MAG: DUF6325 family protein [Blastococcus sp.]
MTLGPIELVVLGFPGSRFTGDIRPRIEELVDRKIVNVIDAVFIRKGADGAIELNELRELTDDPEASTLGSFLSGQLDLISDDDVESLAVDLQPGSSALAIAFEHTWMKPVRDAVTASGGVLLSDIHVPGPVVDEVLQSIGQG